MINRTDRHIMHTGNEKIRWGLIATGAIARAFADGLKHSKTGGAHAAASRSVEKAESFCREFGIPKAYGSYDDILEDSEIQAVYISTPHPFHAEWAIKAARAGKHVLVEKPAGINRQEVSAMIESAAANGVFLMEAYMYRCHPQTARLVEIVREKLIGEVRTIHATFSFRAGYNPESRIWNNALAGGGILDVGGYTTSISRLVAGAAAGLPFVDPISVCGTGVLHRETGVDEYASALLQFQSGIIATVSTGVGVAQENTLKIFGTAGNILVPNPYMPNRSGPADGRIIVSVAGETTPREISVPSPVTSFTHEADAVGRALFSGAREAREMTWNDSLGNAAAQDEWRRAIGLVYESEKPRDTKSGSYCPGGAKC